MTVLDKIGAGLHSAGNSVQDGFDSLGHKLEPKEVEEEARYKKLPLVKSVQTGDILLVKLFGMQSKASANVIRGGQFLFSPAKGGSANSEHALIMLNGTQTVEAKSAGIVSLTVDKNPHTVYRCLNLHLAREAAFVAQRLGGLDHRLTPGHYDFKGCANAPFWHRNQGKLAHQYLRKLYDLVYSDKPGKGPNMFCSEFVSACYEVAAMRINVHALQVDPQGMSVKALEEELNRHNRLFRMLGRYPK
jgi:hypothetical protein